MSNGKQPSELATILGHATVGAVAGVVLGKTLKANTLGIIVGAIIVVFIHAAIDAPVSKAIGDLGV